MAVNLYLVQHGEAKPKEEDPERGLTDKGRRDVEGVAALLADIGAKPHRIYHSGKKRALETAGILSDRLTPEGGVSQADGLAPLDDPAVWARRLDNEQQDIMLVGHMPHVARLASLLLCGDPEKGLVSFTQGAVLSLKRVEGRWTVEWMVTPDFR